MTGLRWVVAAAVMAAALLTGCAPPPVPPAPTDVPTPTPQPPVATAIAALSSGPTATQAAIAAATSIAASTVRITDATVDPSNVSASAVTLFNAGGAPVDMGGWTLLVANYRVTLPKTDYMTLVPSREMIVHLSTSPTPTSGQNVYVGLGALSNTPRIDPDRVVLINPSGNIASTFPAQ